MSELILNTLLLAAGFSTTRVALVVVRSTTAALAVIVATFTRLGAAIEKPFYFKCLSED
jgi:hypothetical protein